jgi:ParB family chromosome partitioning protein
MGAPAIPADAASIKPGGRVSAVVDQLVKHNAGQVEALATDRLHWNPHNPRVDAGDVVDMAASIAAVGVLEPLLVAHASAMQASDDSLPLIAADDFIVIAGHRRLEAAKLAGVTTVPCIVRDDLVGPEADIAMIVENVHREDLTPVEEARSYQRLVDVHGKSQRDIAGLVGRNQSHISKRLQLLALPADLQAKVGTDQLSIDDAVTIAKVADNPAAMKAIAGRPAYQTVREFRKQQGAVRSDYQGSHQYPRSLNDAYFNAAHPLQPKAAARCKEHGHRGVLLMGAACTECWEREIRVDASDHPVMFNDAPAAVPAQRQRERFSDPRDILRRLKCTRCETPGLGSSEQRCAAVRNGHRQIFDHHEFVMEVSDAG